MNVLIITITIMLLRISTSYSCDGQDCIVQSTMPGSSIPTMDISNFLKKLKNDPQIDEDDLYTFASLSALSIPTQKNHQLHCQGNLLFPKITNPSPETSYFLLKYIIDGTDDNVDIKVQFSISQAYIRNNREFENFITDMKLTPIVSSQDKREWYELQCQNTKETNGYNLSPDDKIIKRKNNTEITVPLPSYNCFVNGKEIFNLKHLSASGMNETILLNDLWAGLVVTDRSSPMFKITDQRPLGYRLKCSLIPTDKMVAKK